MKKISLVIPCHNEEENIKLLFNECEKVLSSKYNVEYIYIDDGSSDKTYLNICELAKDNADKEIRGIRFSRNFGKDSAMLAGLKNATGDYVSIIDADLQQDPKYVLDMVDFLESNENFESVACYQENRKESTVLKFFKKMFYKIINKISDTHFEENASDFRTFRKQVVSSILELTEYYRFSKGIFAWVGFNTHYMPYVVKERQYGKTNWSFTKLTKYAFDGFFSFSTVPLKIATLIGLMSSGLSVCYFIAVLIEKFTKGIAVSGYPTIVSLILLIGGIQMVLLGIIGEYLSRTYMEVKKRPSYIIKNEVNSKKE